MKIINEISKSGITNSVNELKSNYSFKGLWHYWNGKFVVILWAFTVNGPVLGST